MTDRIEAIHERLILANGIQLDEVVARHYREDVPWLLAEVDRLRALVDENSVALQVEPEHVRELRADRDAAWRIAQQAEAEVGQLRAALAPVAPDAEPGGAE